jgi:hypothetical protein
VKTSAKFVDMAIVMCAPRVKSLPEQLLMLTPAEYCLDYTQERHVGEVAASARRYRVPEILPNGETNGSSVTRSRANRVNVAS